MTLSFVGISISSSTSSPIAATLPSGATTGDLAFRHWVGYGNNATPPAVADPSGWNRLSRAVLDSSYGLTVPNQTWENVIWWRYLDGTADDTATVTKASVQSVHQEDIAVYRGLTGGCLASALSASPINGTTWTPTPPSPVATTDVVFAMRVTHTAFPIPGGPWTGKPAGWNGDREQPRNAGGGLTQGLWLASRVGSASGFTVPQSIAEQNTLAVFSLIPPNLTHTGAMTT